MVMETWVVMFFIFSNCFELEEATHTHRLEVIFENSNVADQPKEESLNVGVASGGDLRLADHEVILIE